MFTSLILAVLLPFKCQRSPNGELTMSAKPGLTCFESSDHVTLVILDFISTLVYPVAILAWALWNTRKYTSRVSSSDGMRVSGRYKFLFSRFKPEGYYVGALYLTRNALVAANPIRTLSCSTVFRDVHGAAHELHPAVQALALTDNGSQCVRSRHRRR
jgi:hypothetical protein